MGGFALKTFFTAWLDLEVTPFWILDQESEYRNVCHCKAGQN